MVEWLSIVLKSFLVNHSAKTIHYHHHHHHHHHWFMMVMMSFFAEWLINNRRWVYLQLTTWPKLSTVTRLWYAASSDNHYTVLRKTGLFGYDFVLISLMNWGTFAVRSICVNFFPSKLIRLWVFINVFRKKIISNFASFKALQFLTSLSTVSEFEVFVTLISSHWRGELKNFGSKIDPLSNQFKTIVPIA